MFCGFFPVGADVVLYFVTEDSTKKAIDPDAAPTFRAFGSAGSLPGGTGTAVQAESGSVTGATNAAPIVITAVAHGLPSGAYVKIAGVLGNTAANGTFFVTVVDADHFSLDGSIGNGSYISGGTWKTVGLWKLTLTGSVLSALAAGGSYSVLVIWKESGAERTKVLTFGVI